MTWDITKINIDEVKDNQYLKISELFKENYTNAEKFKAMYLGEWVFTKEEIAMERIREAVKKQSELVAMLEHAISLAKHNPYSLIERYNMERSLLHELMTVQRDNQ